MGCIFHQDSGCRMSTTVLNQVNSFLQQDWVYYQSMCKALPEFCNVSVGVWPGRSGNYYETPGLIVWPDIGERVTKCAYAFDGSSDKRPNRGCGCQLSKSNCAPNPHWPCPDENNACLDTDPLSR